MDDTRTASDVIDQLYRLFGEGRLDETLALMDPEVRLQEPGDRSVLPWAGEFVGHSGVIEFYASLGRGLSTIEIDGASLRLLGIGDDQVLTLGTERGTSAETGRTYVSRSAWLWTVQEGRITELQAFHDTAAMLAAMV